MKLIAITAFLFLFAHIAISQYYPVVYKKSDQAAERPGDPFADLPAVGKQHGTKGGRTLDHTQLDSANYWSWDETLAAWAFEAQTIFSYTPNTEIVLSLDEELENQYLETLQYDDNGNLLEYVFQFWTGSSWVNSSRYIYGYDDNDNLVEFIYQSGSGGSFENILRFVYTYDGNGDLAEQLSQDWVAIAWTNDFRRTYTYNANHQRVQLHQESWQSGWVNQFLHTYTYGSSDELLTELVEEWVGDWEINEQTTFSYNGQLQLIEEDIRVYGGGSEVGQIVITYTYDVQGNVISETTQNDDTSQLENTERQLNTYDEENNQVSYLYQHWTTEWVNYDSAHYYWNPVTSITDPSLVNSGMTVYPNPATDELRYVLPEGDEINTYEIQSLDGKIIKKDRKFLNQPIDISGLPNGMFVIIVNTATATAHRQIFIKQ